MKKLNLKTLFLLMCLIMSLDMTAEHMTAEQARSAAQQSLRLKVAKGSSIKSLATRQVMPYSPVSDQRAAVYAVNLGSNDGFVIVGGNSQSQEVIGYCDNGSFNAEEMPANMRSCSSSIGDIVLATYQSENGSTMEFGLPESALEACHPYLLGIPATINRSTSLGGASITFSASDAQVMASKAVVTGHDYKMVGTFVGEGDNENILVFNAEGSAFVPGTAVSPFQAYFLPIGSVAAAPTLNINVDYGSSTGINEIYTSEPNDQQGPIYNLNGQRVTRPGNGIYIMGGKKFKLIKF